MIAEPPIQHISFSYDVPGPGSPEAISLGWERRMYPLLDGADPLVLPVDVDESYPHRLYTLYFSPVFYPLTLSCDGYSVWIPIMATTGGLALKVPLAGANQKVKVYPLDPVRSPAEVNITIGSFTNASEIGVVIVGTSGLTVVEGE